jgi:hypothetical protein
MHPMTRINVFERCIMQTQTELKYPPLELVTKPVLTTAEIAFY